MRERATLMGLRARLNLLLSLILFLVLSAGAAVSLANARHAVVEELRASTELASTLLRGLLVTAGENRADVVERLLAELEAHAHTRHLRISLVPRADPGAGGPASWPRAPAVPAWFSNLVRPAPDVLTRTVAAGAHTVVIAADPADEIEEAWRESRTTLAVLLSVFVGANLVVFVFLGRALRPLVGVSSALSGIEQGDFSARLPLSGLPDIDRISGRFNEMAQALERSRGDNAALAQRSLAIQEQERRYLAHELHDEMGQSITAIKALAASIRERTATSDDAAAASAATIVDVSGEVYARVRQMMIRLHPVILDELGLVPAVELMIDDWNAHHDDCYCSFVSSRALPSLQAEGRIAVYRIVQEALTNVARHARASEVTVSLGMEDEGGGVVCVSAQVSDNGDGFDPVVAPRGLGLAGIRERAASVGGEIRIDTAPGRGTCVRFRAPLPGLQEVASHE